MTASCSMVRTVDLGSRGPVGRSSTQARCFHLATVFFPPRYVDGPTARFITHMFDMRCRENGIEHRCTKVNHPWTNGQVERMNRTIKQATVQRYHYDDHAQLSRHLDDFVSA